MPTSEEIEEFPLKLRKKISLGRGGKQSSCRGEANIGVDICRCPVTIYTVRACNLNEDTNTGLSTRFHSSQPTVRHIRCTASRDALAPKQSEQHLVRANGTWAAPRLVTVLLPLQRKAPPVAPFTAAKARRCPSGIGPARFCSLAVPPAAGHCRRACRSAAGVGAIGAFLHPQQHHHSVAEFQGESVHFSQTNKQH